MKKLAGALMCVYFFVILSPVAHAQMSTKQVDLAQKSCKAYRDSFDKNKKNIELFITKQKYSQANKLFQNLEKLKKDFEKDLPRLTRAYQRTSKKDKKAVDPAKLKKTFDAQISQLKKKIQKPATQATNHDALMAEIKQGKKLKHVEPVEKTKTLSTHEKLMQEIQAGVELKQTPKPLTPEERKQKAEQEEKIAREKQVQASKTAQTLLDDTSKTLDDKKAFLNDYFKNTVTLGDRLRTIITQNKTYQEELKAKILKRKTNSRVEQLQAVSQVLKTLEKIDQADEREIVTYFLKQIAAQGVQRKSVSTLLQEQFKTGQQTDQEDQEETSTNNDNWN